MSFEVSTLKNTYFALRHGTSEANVQGIILSDPKYGIPEYGLTPEGKEEVRQSAETAKKEGVLDESTVIVSSDFKRAKETAERAARVLGIAELLFDPALRERFFGRFEGTSNTNYKKVWEKDANNATHTHKGVESAQAVLERTLTVLASLEAQFSSRKILLVSHGDALQILQTAFEHVPVSAHRTLTHLKTAEIRQLNSPVPHAA